MSDDKGNTKQPYCGLQHPYHVHPLTLQEKTDLRQRILLTIERMMEN